jgi:hypothetical protein
MRFESTALMPVPLDLSAGDENCVAGDVQRDAMQIAGRSMYFIFIQSFFLLFMGFSIG